MPTVSLPELQEALHTLFENEKKPSRWEEGVSLRLEREVRPAEFEALVKLCTETGYWPSVNSSRLGLTFCFSIDDE